MKKIGSESILGMRCHKRATRYYNQAAISHKVVKILVHGVVGVGDVISWIWDIIRWSKMLVPGVFWMENAISWTWGVISWTCDMIHR